MTTPQIYTDRARQALVLAEQEARLLQHNYLGTEHLLLGMLHEGEGGAAVTLTRLGLTLGAVRAQVESIIGRGSEASSDLIPRTPRAKRVLDLALEEARETGHPLVGTEHLLLGLVREGTGEAAQILRGQGVALLPLHHEVLRLLIAPVPAPDIPPPAPDTSLLGRLARNLCREAAAGELFPVIGRTVEIERIAQVLSRQKHNVPLLVGEPGVGKSSVVAGLAHAIVAGTAPAGTVGRRVHALDVGAVFTDPEHRGRFAEVMSALLTELQGAEDVILFLDNALTVLHTPDGRAEALAFFRPVFRSPGVAVVAACTPSAYRRREPDPGLDEWVKPMPIGRLSEEEVLEILTQTRPHLERHHSVVITDEALRAAVEQAWEGLPGQALPGSAIDLLDQASAVAGSRRAAAPQADPVAAEYEEQIARSRRHADSARAAQDSRLERHYDEQVERWSAALALHRQTATEQPPGRRVTTAEVAEALAFYTGLPDAPAPRPPRLARPVPHDPSVWAMS
ncbi:Clp protease N-terminal domain-containing protein [Kitasatospora sp. NPDC047058]|uniref:Clp protease N-terminal domain-containing protein n=1 Tax=Kitasatospora sp. NPDC047058 TaxID=3155620 RepID=UPI0033D2B7AE